MTTFYSNGKLLLTGEYVVLDGAISLALPTHKGQALIIEEIDEPKIVWKSLDHNKNLWFEEVFNATDLNVNISTNDTGHTLLNILKSAKHLNPTFLNGKHGFKVTSILEFPRDWGLGSSSTLINNIANWAKVDAYKLLHLSFGGSGYDIACAKALGPLTYQLKGHKPIVTSIPFYPTFSEHLYFVHLNKKQNSREGIALYKQNRTHIERAVLKITAISKLVINCNALVTFEALISRHEFIISQLIKLPTVKERYFSDYEGAIKSLGAWGGDFILVTSKNNPAAYFSSKGYHTIIPYKDMILN